MKGLIAFLERYFVPIAGRLGAQRHLVAIRDGFALVMPLIIVGAMALLVKFFPIDGYKEFMDGIFGPNWSLIIDNIWTGSFAIMALLVTLGVAYNLAKSYKVDPLSAAAIAFASYMILTPPTPKDWGVNFAWLGAQGLFVSLIVAIVSTEIFRFFIQRKIVIKMPAGVPDAVGRSFVALIPAAAILLTFTAVKLVFQLGLETSVHEFIFTSIQAPLGKILSGSLVSVLVIVFLIQLLWSFGLHGANILGPVIDPIYLPLIEQNMKLFKEGTSSFDVPNIINKVFLDVFVNMGGSGTTIGIIIAALIVAKSQQHRYIARSSTMPGLFNINEPVIFGMPIVLNPILIIPFIITPMVLTAVTYFAMATGAVARTVVLVPWTSPPIISGYLATASWTGAALQVVNLLIATAIYLPFVIMSDRMARKTEEELAGGSDATSSATKAANL